MLYYTLTSRERWGHAVADNCTVSHMMYNVTETVLFISIGE